MTSESSSRTRHEDCEGASGSTSSPVATDICVLLNRSEVEECVGPQFVARASKVLGGYVSPTILYLIVLN